MVWQLQLLLSLRSKSCKNNRLNLLKSLVGKFPFDSNGKYQKTREQWILERYAAQVTNPRDINILDNTQKKNNHKLFTFV